ncbi:MAG: hypothetical protein OXH11_21125 [Candidatus Aminicenantes bacterium]|nr:hypothetical protein [Candidatus Aminicenantes bacterium]
MIAALAPIVHDDEIFCFHYGKNFRDRRLDQIGGPAAGAMGPAVLPLDGWASLENDDQARNMELYIYWGGPLGYSVVRRQSLPTLFGRELEVADLDRGGWVDIVVANFGEESGHRQGYRLHRDSYGPSGSGSRPGRRGKTWRITIGPATWTSSFW